MNVVLRLAICVTGVSEKIFTPVSKANRTISCSNFAGWMPPMSGLRMPAPYFFEFVYSAISAFEIKRGSILYRLANSLWSRSIVFDEKEPVKPTIRPTAW